MTRLAVAILLCVTTGCRKEPEARPGAQVLALPSEKEAAARMDAFLSAYVAADVPAVLRMLCEQDTQSQLSAAEFIQRSQAAESPFRVEKYELLKLEPVWRGEEPYFRATVLFPRRSGPGHVEHAYELEVERGCLARLMGGDPRGYTLPQERGAPDEEKAPRREPEPGVRQL
ncbi:MAG: hypothetical protein AB2A00_06170 [Myxococcota bacterium]